MHPSSSPVATVVSVKLINRYIGYLFHAFNMCQINVSNKSRFRIGTYSCAFSRRLTAIPVSTSVARTEQSDEPVRITDTGSQKHVTNHFRSITVDPRGIIRQISPLPESTKRTALQESLWAETSSNLTELFRKELILSKQAKSLNSEKQC